MRILGSWGQGDDSDEVSDGELYENRDDSEEEQDELEPHRDDNAEEQKYEGED